MRVLFVISSLNTGGAQRALSNIVTNLPDDWEIDILLNNTDNIVYPYKGNLIDLCIQEPSNRESILYQLKVLIKRYAKLRKLKKEGAYDTCVSFLDSANVANILTGSKYCKTIISARLYLSLQKTFTYLLALKAIKFIYKRAGHIVAVSKGVENDLTGNLKLKKDIVSTIYNGCPVKNIIKKAGERKAGNAFTFITMGRCHQQKSQWHLIRAFARFAKEHENSRLVIIGDGPYIEYLKQLITAYHLIDKISLIGFIDNPYQELINADVFIFPSLYEGFPNALLEAMACGLPVIASDFRSGAREILAPGTDIDFEQTSGVELAEYGIITPVCSGIRHLSEAPLEPQESLLLEAMELMYNDEDIRHRYCVASKKRVKDFSTEKCVEQWCKVIECKR